MTGPIPYIERTREWYLALGYGNPYRYAQFDEVPFRRLPKPLADCVLTLVTTAAPWQEGKGPQGPGAPMNAAVKFYVPYTGDTAGDHDLRISHVAIDRKHTSMEDPGCWFPLPLMRRFAAAGRFRLAPRFHGAPTNRSQRHTLEADVPLIVRRCQEDGVDAALLVPNCPVCHQTLALVARGLEAAGIATVVMGCARDIVEQCGVPRFLFSDFPLGNGAGKPHDAASQQQTLELALQLLQEATAPRTTLQSPLRWSASDEWKLDYCNARRASPQEIDRARAEFEAAATAARSIKAAELAGRRKGTMPRLQPLPPETTPELKGHFDFFLSTLGFTPNSVLTMQRKPKLVQAFAQLNAAVMDPAGVVDLGFRRLIGHVASKAAGCLYCQAHTLLGAQNFGIDEAKLADVWNYADSPHYSARERVALDFALAAAAQPNEVTDALFARVREHWSEEEIVELLGVVAMFGFLNRWNDTMATPLEAVPLEVARKAAGARGWSPGKHGQP